MSVRIRDHGARDTACVSWSRGEGRVPLPETFVPRYWSGDEMGAIQWESADGSLKAGLRYFAA